MRGVYDFSVPNRQSVFAIIMILLKTIRIISAQIFPLLLILLIGNSENKPTTIIIFIAIVAVIAMILSIIKFFKTYFYISDNELVVNTGVFKKVKTTIPFDRIQSIHFEQNIFQQMLDVTQLTIDTAGSEKSEFIFHAIENDKALALRNYIFANKRQTTSEDTVDIPDSESEPDITNTKILSLDFIDLLKVGLTENHLKSTWIIFIFFYWIFQNLQEAGMNMEEYSEQVSDWNWTFQIITFFIIILVLISIVISLIRIILANYNLNFIRTEKGFKIIRGLFSKKEISVPDHKIQIISWTDNLLKSIIGFKDLYMSQASSTQLKTKQSIKISGCNEQHIQEVIQSVMGNIHPNLIEVKGIDKSFFIRYMVIVLAIMSIGIILISFTGDIALIPYLIIFTIYRIFVRYLSFRKRKYGYNEDVIFIKGGKWGNRSDLLPVFKLQGIKLNQSPFQTRHQLCTLILFTASGKLKIPYITHESGQDMVDFLMYKVETSSQNWM